MPKPGKLTKPSEFKACAKSGRKFVTKSLIIQIGGNRLGEARIGYTVSKRVSKLAVERNRVKRRLRAAVAEVFVENEVKDNDYVIIGRVEALDREFAKICGDLEFALTKTRNIAKVEDENNDDNNK